MARARNAAISWHFERDPIPYALDTDWPVGAAGFEPVHQESCPIGPIAIVRRDEWQQIVRRTRRRVHDLRSPQDTTAVKPAGRRFLMHRFEIRRPNRPVRH